MKIGILSASVWEVRQTIRALGLLPTAPGAFDGGTGKHSVSLRLSGMGQKRASRAAMVIAGLSPDLLISTGFSGSLREGIRIGDLVVDRARSQAAYADTIVDLAQKNHMACHQGAFYSSNQVIAKSSEKQKIGAESGAIAVEMESQGIFEVIKPKKIPLLFVRSISDGLDQNLPDVSKILGKAGAVKPNEIFKIAFKPWQWTDFIRLARGSKKAETSLAKILKEFLDHV